MTPLARSFKRKERELGVLFRRVDAAPFERFRKSMLRAAEAMTRAVLIHNI